MKRNFIYSKKSVRTLLLKLEPYFLSHAERGEPFQNQDFGGNTFVSALRADPISASDSDFQFWRATWVKYPPYTSSIRVFWRLGDGSF